MNHGLEEERARDLFYALWIPDEFMRRVEADEKWSLFCPTEAPKLQDAYGEEFDKLYRHYEQTVTSSKVINARDLWMQICTTQIETGTPYLLYKDACNLKSNQKNLGTIRGSNLCCEIVEYHDKDETAVCTLASIALPKFVTQHGFNFDRLVEMAGIVTTNLNKVIDKTSYPVFGAESSNNAHRPIGIGVQGMSDVFQMMGLPYDSEEAMSLNQQIFEAIYYGAVKKSVALAQKYGAYTSFQGSGEWTPKLINKIIEDKGSVQHTTLSDSIKEVFKTTWELSQKTLIDHAAARGPYIDQSQSLNLYLPNPTTSQLTSMHFYAWKRGLKTGQYYLRSQPKASPIQFTVETCDSCSA